MSFTDEQVQMLNENLDRSKVKERAQAGRKLSYIEGWAAIAEANRIFGHDKWERRTSVKQLGEPEQVNGKWRVRFMGEVTITIRDGDGFFSRDGIGYGAGIAQDMGDAFESAIKEAETDATKRALMTFGWPFGLALYDKSQEHVGTNGNSDGKPTDPPREWQGPLKVTELKAKLRQLAKDVEACEDGSMLTAVLGDPDNNALMQQCRADLPDWWEGKGDSGGLVGVIEKKQAEFRNEQPDYYAAG